MSKGMAMWRQRRLAARNRRAFARVVDSATTPAMEQELMSLTLGRQSSLAR
jgi:hypothetical protein